MISCKSKTDNINHNKNGDDEIIITPSTAKAIYNQAYNENYDADNIDYIIANAKNAYVLIDAFQAGVSASVEAIKTNGNEVAAYISIGTGENWR